MFHQWGVLVYRWRWPVLLLSLIPLAISPVFISQGIKLSDANFTHIGADYEKANDLLNEQLPKDQGSSFNLIFQSTTLKVTDSDFRNELDAAIKPLLADSRVNGVTTPYNSPQGKELISQDQHEALATVTLFDNNSTTRSNFAHLRGLVRSDTLQIYATGIPAINHDFDAHLESGLQRAESASLPIILILLLLIFGTIVAGLLPLAMGGLSIVTALGGVYLMSHHFDTSQYTINIVTLIGLGVSIDYSLFIASRFKEELEKNVGLPDQVAKSLATAVERAGKTIAFSGLAVAVGLAGLLFYQGTFLSSMGIAGSIVVLSAIFYALTTLPALLSILGSKVNRLRIPIPKNTIQQSFWKKLSETVIKHPWIFLIPALILLLALASPIKSMRIANAGINALPPDAETRIGQEKLNDFDEQNLTKIPIVVQFDNGNPMDPKNVSYLYDLSRRLQKIPGVTKLESPVDLDSSYTKDFYQKLYSSPKENLPSELQQALPKSVGQNIAILNAETKYDPTSDQAQGIVREIRREEAPTNGRILVTGLTAINIDFLNYIYHRSLWAVGFIIFATLLIIFVMLRSIILPIKAVLMNILSISASFGILVFLFQEGHLSRLLNFTAQSLDPSIPVLLFCIVFGLSMDYEVLLLSRIKEAYDELGDNRQAVARGLQKSAILITGAGLIMLSVFAAFGIADVVIIKSIGIGMAIAVFIDMTIVRAIIVPALMRILGNINWWPGRHANIKPALNQATATVTVDNYYQKDV